MDIIKLDGYNNIYAVDNFSKEWEKLFKKKKASDRRKADEWLDNHLSLLDSDAEVQTNFNPVHFEPVTSSNPQIYSIHYKSKVNQKVLYYLITGKNEVILLTAFIEKGKEDYKVAKERAENKVRQHRKEWRL